MAASAGPVRNRSGENEHPAENEYQAGQHVVRQQIGDVAGEAVSLEPLGDRVEDRSLGPPRQSQPQRPEDRDDPAGESRSQRRRPGEEPDEGEDCQSPDEFAGARKINR